MKILALGPNSTKFRIHNLWASRELEMRCRVTGGGGEGPECVGVIESDHMREVWGQGWWGGEWMEVEEE